MVASYRVVPYLQRCYAWAVKGSAVRNYWECYINVEMDVVTRACSGFCWCVRALPRALRALGGRAYISVRPLAAMLQYINVPFCVDGSKGRVGIQIWCIPEGRDTNNLYPGIDATIYRHNKTKIICTLELMPLYIDTTKPLLIVDLNLLIILSL